MEYEIEKAIRKKAGDVHHLHELQKLESLFLEEIDLNDFYEKLIDYLTKNYPASETRALTVEELREIDAFIKRYAIPKLTASEQWIVRGFVIGKLMEARERAEIPITRRIELEGLPAKVAEAVKVYQLTPREAEALRWTLSHGAQHLTSATNATINRVQSVLFDNVAKRQGIRQLRKDLEDEFFNDEREINRNWNRVAISETNYAFNQGYLAQLKAEEWVLGLSLPGRCDQCGKWIDGKIYPVIVPKSGMEYETLDPKSKEYENRAWLWEHTIWLSKDNYGRSAASRKRIDKDGGNEEENLAPREHHEKFMPSIPMHPHCRCRWVKFNPERQFVEKGELKLRLMDERAWRKWYESQITPIIEGLRKHG